VKEKQPLSGEMFMAPLAVDPMILEPSELVRHFARL